VPTSEQNEENRFICGFEEEWKDFRTRNSVFFERLPNLIEALTTAFFLPTNFADRDDMFLFTYGRVCVEDFFEILLLCCNGYGYGAERLIRGLYERAVTLHYLHDHPAEIDDFIDFHLVSNRKLMIACRETMGSDMFSDEEVARIEAEYQQVKDKFEVTTCETCGTKRVGHHWSKLDFVSMAKKTSLGQLIVPGYYLPLAQAHATPSALFSRLKQITGGALSFNDIAQRGPADKALRLAHNIMLDVLRVQEERFKTLGLKEQRDRCLQDFAEIYQSKK
jgi:hypothetical protein